MEEMRQFNGISNLFPYQYHICQSQVNIKWQTGRRSLSAVLYLRDACSNNTILSQQMTHVNNRSTGPVTYFFVGPTSNKSAMDRG